MRPGGTPHQISSSALSRRAILHGFRSLKGFAQAPRRDPRQISMSASILTGRMHGFRSLKGFPAPARSQAAPPHDSPTSAPKPSARPSKDRPESPSL